MQLEFRIHTYSELEEEERKLTIIPELCRYDKSSFFYELLFDTFCSNSNSIDCLKKFRNPKSSRKSEKNYSTTAQK